VERFTKDYQQYLTEWSVYNRKLKEYSSSPLLHTQMPVKPKLPSALDYKKEFNSKKKELYPFTYEVTKYASQQPFINFDRAVTVPSSRQEWKEREKKGLKDCFPKYKKKSYSSGSFYIGGDLVKVKTSVSCSRRLENKSQKQYLKIPKFGYVQLKEKLRFEGYINSVTISQRGDRFFASFSIEISQEEFDRTHKAAVQNKTAVGIDLGLKSALVLSDGMAIKAPKPLKKSLLRLKRLQRQLNRKNHPRTKGDKTKVSKNYIKQSKRLNKLHLRIHNIREDFIHKVTTALVRTYEYICLEDLNVKGMMRNHHLARAISDIGFYRFKWLFVHICG
jgi:putative transposase